MKKDVLTIFQDILIKGVSIFLMISLFLLIPDKIFAQLSGNYTIGTGGDYANFNDAVNDPSTKIRFAIPVNSNVKVEVFNILGQKVIDLVNETKPAGYYEVQFNPINLASGTYIYRIQADKFIQVKK